MSNHELRTDSLDAAHRRTTNKTKPAKTKPATVKGEKTMPAKLMPAKLMPEKVKPAKVKPAKVKPAKARGEKKEKAGPSIARGLRGLATPLAAPLRVLKKASGAVWAVWDRAYDDALARPVRAVRVFGITVAVLVVLAGLAWYQTDHYSRLDTARADAVEQGEAAVGRLLSYNFASMDRQVERTQDLVTGKFKDDYAQLITTRIVPGAKDKQVSVQTSVDRSAVISSSLSEVVLLMYVDTDSETQSDTPADGDSALRGLRVTLDNEDGKWKVSDLTPV